MKRCMAMALAAVMAFTLIGCGKEQEQEDLNAVQYQEYAQGLLDANYHGDFKAYTEMTGASEADAQAKYENNVRLLAESLEEYFVIDSKDEAVQADLLAIAEELYMKTKYTVGEAVLNETTQMYSVKISIEPLAFLQDVENAVADYMDDLNQRMLNREFEDMTDAEYEKLFADGLITILEEALPEATYEDATSVTVVFQYDEASQTTYIADEDLEKIAGKMIVG